MRGKQRGFTLIELMTVVVIIGVFASLAMPAMIDARREQRAYDDAAAINELIRNGRTRAIGRGTATLVTLDMTGAQRGRYRMSEGTGPSPQAPAGQLKAPRPSCSSTDPNAWILNQPSGNVNWSLPNQFIDGIDMNGGAEIDANIWSKIYAYGLPQNGNASCNSTNPQRVDICFTAAGRPFVSVGANPPVFTPADAFTGVIEVQVARLFTGASDVTQANAKGPIRHVILPPSGISRINSTLP